jgi:hypothetical protein
MMSKIDPAYFQVAHPSAGGSNPAGKDSSNCDDALGNPGRFTRNAVSTATPDPDSELQKTRDEQLGTNIELTWTRYGHDVKDPKANQGFKKNFNNPTDNPSDVKVKS